MKANSGSIPGSAFSRKHYNQIAALIRARQPSWTFVGANQGNILELLANDFADLFKVDNHNFKREKFLSQVRE